MAEPGHKDSWSSPAGGWPTFCRYCGRRIADACPSCDSLLSQRDDEENR